MDFKLTEAPCTLTKITLDTATNRASGESGRSTKMVGAELVLEVDVTKCLKHVEILFPSAKVICDIVAGDETISGLDITTRGKLLETSLAFFSKTDKAQTEATIDVTGVLVKKAAKLKINKDGEAKLVIKPAMFLQSGQLSKLWECIGADSLVTVRPTQLDLEDMTDAMDGAADAEDEGDGKSTGVKKKIGKKATAAAPASLASPAAQISLVRSSIVDLVPETKNKSAASG